jgi:uncharacterized Zn finger protein (UPF0148 family)
MKLENENNEQPQDPQLNIGEVMCSKYCGDCGNTIRDDGEIFCVVIQSRVDEDDETCDEFSGGEPQYR